MISLALLLLACPAQEAVSEPSPRRQFDFWVGEWEVNNRFLQADGSWKDGGGARARITPVLDGDAILEEWSGTLSGRQQLGFSLRAYDKASKKWKLLLNWPSGGDTNFGTLEGSFRHGRGEFFFDSLDAQGQRVMNRYTFSDGLANSVRWDNASSNDLGQSWRTSWIMEFSRTRAARETNEARLFDVPFEEGQSSPYPETRALDFLVGDWSGTELVHAADDSVVERPFDYRARLLTQGCLLLERVEFEAEDGQAPQRRLGMHSWISKSSTWESRIYREGSGRFEPTSWKFVDGAFVNGAMRLSWNVEDLEDGRRVHMAWTRSEADEERLVREWFLEEE